MRFAINVFLFLVLAVGTSQLSSAQVNVPDGGATGVATMFARDPLTQSLCFRDGGPGGVFQDGQTKNRCSDLNFNSYSANGFSVGIEGGKEGVIIDLGTPAELKTKYGYQETVGSGQGFASISVKNGRAWILKDYKTGQLQDLAQAAELFRASPDSVASAQVKLGHVYLLRVVDRNDDSFEMFAKVLVLAFTPGESVTVRWSVMSNNESARVQVRQ